MSKKEQALDDTRLLLDHNIHIPTQTIFLTGEVDDEMYETLLLGFILIEERHKDKTNILIELNSHGGSWYAGIAMYDRIKVYKYPVTIHVSGMALSLASVILQAADTKLITPGSTIMVHDGSDMTGGSPDNMLAWAKHGKEICKAMYGIYAESSDKTAVWWEKHCKTDFILSAEKAIALGLADGYIS